MCATAVSLSSSSMLSGLNANLEPLARTANPNGYGFLLRCKFASAAEDARSINSLSLAWRQGRRLESDMMKRPCCVDRPMFTPSGFAANREKEVLRLVILTTLTYTGLTAGRKTRIPPGFSSPLHRFDNATVCHCRLIEFATRRPDLFSRPRTSDRSGDGGRSRSSQRQAAQRGW